MAAIAEPLHRLIHCDVDWVWGESQQTALETLKAALTSSKIMAYPDTSRPYILYTNACDYAMGAILCQEDDEEVECPIQYQSNQLTPSQENYFVTEKEAFVYTLKKLHCYLLFSPCVIYTDHKPFL